LTATVSTSALLWQRNDTAVHTRSGEELMESFVYFILGVLFSAVIALFSPFWTDRFRSWRGSRSVRAKRKRLVELKSDAQTVRRYQSNPATFQAFVLERLVYIAFLTAAFASVSGTLAVFGVLGSPFYLISGTSGIVASVGALVTLPVCSKTLRVIRKVRSEDYVDALEVNIVEIESSIED
jgi:hypothetical protein